MRRPWRVGVLGLGHWYSAFGLARALPEYPKAELVAVAWPDPTQRDGVRLGVRRRRARDYDEVLARDDVDIVHIAPPVAEIPDLTIRAARAGKHIILGKPMAMTVAEADQMVEAPCARRGDLRAVPGAVPAARRRDSRRGSTPARSARSPSCIRPAAGRSPRTGTGPARRAGSSIRRRCRAAPSSTRASTGSICSAGWRQRGRQGRGEDRQPGPQGHRRRGLGVGDVHLRQRRPSRRSKPPGRSTRHARPGRRPSRTASSGSRWSARAARYIDQWFRDPGRAVLAAGAERLGVRAAGASRRFRRRRRSRSTT